MRRAHGVGPVHVGEVGDPLLGWHWLEHDLAVLLGEKPVLDGIDLRHHRGRLDEMRHAVEADPVADHVVALHPRIERAELVRRRHRHDDPRIEPPVHQLGRHIDAVRVPGVVIDGPRLLQP